MMRQARVRTESMAQRLAKKPLSEGFELWDRGYVLGAMRLFIFKAETLPPFQLGPCLDAMSHLLMRLEEYPDAKENFAYAQEKYELIQQPVVAEMMRIKGIEAQEGPKAALQQLDELLLKSDPKREAHVMPDGKQRSGLARAYGYRAELLCDLDIDANASAALEDAKYAAQLGWDRVHVGHFNVGKILAIQGDIAGAIAALERCVSANRNYVAAYELLGKLLMQQRTPESLARALQVLSTAIEMHPKSSLIREKAFILSEQGKDDEALAMLDVYIADPPHEETESLVAIPGATTAVFNKAKAAILADMGKIDAATIEVNKALQCCPGDEEAERIRDDLQHIAENTE